MFEAFAKGLNAANSARPIDALDVRRAIRDELTHHPEMWHDHFQRKEQLKQMQHGDFLLQSAGKCKYVGPTKGKGVLKQQDKKEEKMKRRRELRAKRKKQLIRNRQQISRQQFKWEEESTPE